MRQIIYLTLLILCFSCEKEISGIDIPFEGQKLIIISFFNPYENLEVTVYKTIAPDALPEHTIVNNAMVVLFEDDKAIDTLVFENEKYVSKIVPSINKNYQLIAAATGFPSVKSTIETIPTKSLISEVTQFKDTTGVKLLINFNNAPNQVSYFDISSNAYFGEDNQINTGIGRLERAPEDGLNCEFIRNNRFSNICFKEESTNITLEVGGRKIIYNNDGTVDFIPFHKYDVILSTISPSFFEYFRGIDESIESHGDEFSETPLTWTNIENGYGVFAGYDFDTFEFTP